MGYLAIEYIDGMNMSTYLESASPEKQTDVVNPIVDAPYHLPTLPIPLNEGPEPAAGSSLRGYLWSDSGLSTSLASFTEMEKWMNRILVEYQPGKQIQQFEFSTSRLVLCHTDLVPRNILRLDNGKIALLDWGSAGFYPPIFEIYAFVIRVNRKPIFASILDRLRLDEAHESQIQLLADVERILLFSGVFINR